MALRYSRPVEGDADVAMFLKDHAALNSGASVLMTFSALWPLRTMCGYVTPKAEALPGQPLDVEQWLAPLGRVPRDEARLLEFVHRTTGLASTVVGPMPTRPGEVGVLIATVEDPTAESLAAEIRTAVLQSRITRFHVEYDLNHTLERALKNGRQRPQPGSVELADFDRAIHQTRVDTLTTETSERMGVGSLRVFEAVAESHALAVTAWCPQAGLEDSPRYELPSRVDLPPPPAASSGSHTSIEALVQSSWRRRRRLSGVVAGDDGLHLVIAIPYGVGHRNERPAGVVLHAIPIEDAAQLGDYEIAFQSTLATWLGRIAAERRLSSTVTNLGRKLAATANPDRAAREGGQGAAVDRDAVFERCDARLRARLDVKMLLETVPDMLHELRTLCGATSCTFRLLTGDHSGESSVSLNPRRMLRRVYSEGNEEREASPWELSLADAPTSVNAWVASSGLPVYLRSLPDVPPGHRIDSTNCPDLANYTGLESVSIFRQGIRSELCVPVFAEDRLVGTLNIESPEEAGFDQVALSVGEYAQVIGIALLEARRRIAVEVMESAGGLLDRLHELAGEVRSAREEIHSHESELGPTLARLVPVRLDRIQDMTGLRYEVPSSASSPEPQLLRDVVHSALQGRSAYASLPLEDHLAGATDHGLLDTTLDADQAGSLRFALTQAFSNVNRHYKEPKHKEPKRRVRRSSNPRSFTLGVHVMRVGGVDNLVVQVVSRLTERNATLIDVQRLFREPLPDPDTRRVRLGAYLAGEIIRRRGGSACSRVFVDSRSTSLVVEFAVPMPLTGGEDGQR